MYFASSFNSAWLNGAAMPTMTALSRPMRTLFLVWSESAIELKLNTGNPGRFGFKLPNSVRQALALHIDEAVPYCDVRGMAAARNVICTYHIGRGLQGIMPNDVFICNGVSEAASMLLNALIGTGDEILLPSPCYSLWSNNAYLCGGKPVF